MEAVNMTCELIMERADDTLSMIILFSLRQPIHFLPIYYK